MVKNEFDSNSICPNCGYKNMIVKSPMKKHCPHCGLYHITHCGVKNGGTKVKSQDERLLIRILAYELYKADWKRVHISNLDEMETIFDWHSSLVEARLHGENDPSLQRYIEENGYGGQLYACFEEFLQSEYMDYDYMTVLFRMTGQADLLLPLYLKDAESIIE